MRLWQGILLGLVQGLTEFLPVSSSGHLVVVEALTGVKTPGVFVEVVLHVATLGSVFVVYGRRLWNIVLGVAARRPDDLRYAGLLIVATIPGGALGWLLHDTVERVFHTLVVVGMGFLVTGIVLWSTRHRSGDRVRPTAGGALLIGAAQAIAILPGVSRSGSTVSAALWSGLAVTEAAEFSFLMAVPIIAGAAVKDALHAGIDIAAIGVVPLAAGFVVAFASGIWSIRFLVALLRRGRFYVFAPYCWAAGVLTLVYARWLA